MPPKPVCVTDGGYSWCEILNKCLRIWEEACSYPSNCLTWNDGCNMCSLQTGEEGMILGACTEMYCFQQDKPYCAVYAPEVGIEPWLSPPVVIDPMPPVVNPFIGDGH